MSDKNMVVTAWINTKYNFEFDIVEDKDAVHLQDKDGFNFLSINLKNNENRLMDENTARFVLDNFKDDIENYLKEMQDLMISETKRAEIERRLRQNLSEYRYKRDELKKQLDESDDDFEINILTVQIKQLDELIDELSEYIVDY